VVFKLTHETWKETVLYTFTGGSDGAFSGDPVVFDPDVISTALRQMEAT
jgi:hypothetical protein